MRLIHHIGLVLGLALAACAAPTAQARDDTGMPGTSPIDHLPALQGDHFKLTSTHAGRDYHVFVRLPEGYDANTASRYPVVYLLDGDSLFPLLAPTHLFLHYDEKLPEAVIVGIAYGSFDPAINKRNVDFSALAEDTRAGEGRAAKFLDFLREELLPQVERRYRVDPQRRVLAGQSRAGYFVLWSALRDPDLFWGRIASNASFTPARTQLFDTPAAHRRDDLGVVVGIGLRDTDFRIANAAEWTQHWQARTDAPWRISHQPLPGGTHAASIGEIYRHAMLWLFRDQIPEVEGQ